MRHDAQARMRLLVVLLGSVLLLTACTSDPPTPKELPPVKHAPAHRVADKDEKAVLSTLATLNPCAFVATPKGGTKALDNPHACVLQTASDQSIHIRMWARSSHASRWALPRKVIAGAAVDSIRAITPHECQLEIPVSFRYAVLIHGFDLHDPCKLAETYAATVIARLRTPDEVRHAAARPDLSKVACDVLVTAFAKSGRTAEHNGGREPVNLDACSVKAGDVDDAVLELRTGARPTEDTWGKKWRTFGGKDIYVADYGCRWVWSEGQLTGKDNRVVSLSTCLPSGLPEKLVAAIVDELGKPLAPVSVPDLVYPAGQPTEADPGACTDYQGVECEPAVPVTVPDGAGFLTEAALADHHVVCAATADAVRAQFPDLRGVVPADRDALCSYVGPMHDPPLDVYVQDWDVAYQSDRSVTIAGHLAVRREHEESEARPAVTTLCVDSGYARDGGSRHWFWCFDFPHREDGGAERLVPLVTAFAKGHLT